MILFTILTVMAFVLIMFMALTVAVGGAAFVIIFADVIVCVAIIVFIVKRLTGWKKKK